MKTTIAKLEAIGYDTKHMAQSEVTGLFFGVTLYASGCDDKTGGDGAKVIRFVSS